MFEIHSQRRCLIALVLVTLVVRSAVILVQQERLGEDVDAYLGVAAQIADGRGFSVPNSDQPTAYRPPLYPLLLAFAGSARGHWGIIILHLGLGVGTVLLVWRLCRRLVSDSAALVAACLIAFDPLLLQYSALPMTETLCTFLSALALNLMVPLPESRTRQLGLGLLLGLCVLSRPTFLVFGICFVLGWLIRSRSRSVSLAGAGMVLLGMLAGVSPWGIRNAIVFGEFRVTTTHGGYTLLLANNPVFYDEVVKASWGTVWHGESLNRWQTTLEAAMKETAPEVDTEFERDRWMSRLALSHIRENPGRFLLASGHRFLWFWNVFPPQSAMDSVENRWTKICKQSGLIRLEPAAKSIARTVALGIALFYVILFGSVAVGFLRIKREEWSLWWPLALLIASFCAVHLVYWTDARMRAPVMPAVALLAARAWFLPKTQSDESASRATMASY